MGPESPDYADGACLQALVRSSFKAVPTVPTVPNAMGLMMGIIVGIIVGIVGIIVGIMGIIVGIIMGIIIMLPTTEDGNYNGGWYLQRRMVPTMIKTIIIVIPHWCCYGHWYSPIGVAMAIATPRGEYQWP